MCVVQVLGQTDVSALQEIDSLLGLPPTSGHQAAGGGEMNEQMEINAIQEELMRDVSTSVNTPPATMNARPALSAALVPNSQVQCSLRFHSVAEYFQYLKFSCYHHS